jgi:hypothetical protein
MFWHHPKWPVALGGVAFALTLACGCAAFALLVALG